MLKYTADLVLPDKQLTLLLDYVDQALGALDFAELVQKSRKFFSQLGGNAVNFGIFESASNELVGLSTNMQQNWIDQYWDNNYVDYDPLVDYFPVGDRPAISGWRLNGPGLDCDDNAERIIREAKESGYPYMMFQPVRVPAQQYSGSVTFFTDVAESEANTYLRNYGGLLTLAATCAGQRAAQLFSPAGTDDAPGWLQYQRALLSPREIEVLKWLANGCRTDQIAFKMDLQPVTVHMHITSARNKMGARTREQLMCMAVLRGYV